MPDLELWSTIRRLRCQFADEIENLRPEQWEEPTWCEGWRVRDVLGHLVYLAEASQPSVFRDLLRARGRPDRSVDRTARRLGAEAVPQLAERLRAAADGRFHVLGSPPAVALGDVLVHSADTFRPLDLAKEPKPEEAALVLPVYRRVSRLAFHTRLPRDVRLIATDTDWQSGQGPDVRGKALDLLLLLANRHQVVSELEGPGVLRLTL